MDDNKRIEEDLDIKWEMDLERDKKARERILGDVDDVDDIKLVNDKTPELQLEKELDKEDSEIILKESLDGYERDILRSSQKDIYNKFGGDTETFEPIDDMDFQGNDISSELNVARDSVSFYKDIPEYESDIDLIPKKPVVTKKYKKEPNKMKIAVISVIVLLLCVLAALVNKINDLSAKNSKDNGNQMVENTDNETIQILTEKNKNLSNDIEILKNNIADMMASSGGEAIIPPTEEPKEAPLETVIPTEQAPAAKPVPTPVPQTAKPVPVPVPQATKKPQVTKNANIKSAEETPNMTRAEAERNSVLTKDVKYTVVRGDSLIRLSKRFYGDAKLYTKIKEANGLTDEELYMGQKIIIPKK